MHRAYQPITPANNKLLKQRWDMSRYDLHRRKVHSAKAVIDNKPPQTYMHLHLKLKKLQVEEETLATIERDNRILLEKMSYIMRTKGRVDNHNDVEPKSLNKTKRQRELLRVTHENQAILKRITSKEPHYNHLQWEDDWTINEGYMDNIAKYPKDWYKQMCSRKKTDKSLAASASKESTPTKSKKQKDVREAGKTTEETPSATTDKKEENTETEKPAEEQ